MRLHQAAVSALAERLGLDRQCRPSHCISRSVRADARLGQDAQRPRSDLGKLSPLFLHPWPVVAGQERTARDRLCQGGRSRCAFRLVLLEEALGFLRGALGRQNVDPGPLREVELVAAEGGGQGACAIDAARREHASELAHEDAERLVPGRRRCVAPENVRQLVSRHRPSVVGYEVGEEETALPPRKVPLVDHDALGFDGDPACEEDLQSSLLLGSCRHLASILRRIPSVGRMNNSFLIRMLAIAAALPLVALTTSAAAGRLPRPLGAGEQPLSAGVHILDLVSREQGRKGYAHLPRIAIKLPAGWFNYNGWAVNDGGPLGLAFWDVAKVYSTGCRWQGKPLIDPGRTVDGLARTLALRPLRHATRPRSAVLGGFHGMYLRWSVPSKIDFSRCGQGYFESWTGRGWSTDRWQQGQVDRLWIVDINGKRLVVDANYMPSATLKQRAELDRIVHSIKFLSSSPPRSSASSSGQSRSAWRRNTWNETRSGVVHAYFIVPNIHLNDAAAFLRIRTPTTKVRLTCRLRLGSIRRLASWRYNDNGDIHTVAFPMPSRLRRSARAKVICHTSARIDSVLMGLGPLGDPVGRYPWIKLRRTGAAHLVRVVLASPVLDLYHSAPVRVSGMTAGSVDARLLGAIDRAGRAYDWSPYPWRALRDHRGTWRGLLPSPPLFGIYRLQLRLDHGRRFLSSARWLMRVFPHGTMKRPSFPTAGGVVRGFVAHLPGQEVLVASRFWPLARFDHRDLRLNRQFVIAYAPRGEKRPGSRLGLFISTVRNGFHGRWRLLEATTQPYG